MEPRAPTADEIGLVKLLLPPGAFPDVEVYRTQADHFQVTGKCDCGCPTVSFTVDAKTTTRATFNGDPLLPIEAEAGEGDDFVQLILFARHGWLESLELIFYNDEPPSHFPEASKLRLIKRPPRNNG